MERALTNADAGLGGAGAGTMTVPLAPLPGRRREYTFWLRWRVAEGGGDGIQPGGVKAEGVCRAGEGGTVALRSKGSGGEEERWRG